MNEPVWVLRTVIDAMHDMQIAEHGGLQGLRDEGLLESALSRPENLHRYETSDLYELAAAYAFGISRNHPFADGNKRTAFLAAYVFLKINGLNLQADQVVATTAMLSLASGQSNEAEFSEWLRQRTQIEAK